MFISYAQNQEDVMLRRAFKDVDKGFYIDVGANDPVIDSVTKVFYDVGWRGVNIEPINEWYEKLEKDRPDDVNLQVAAGERKGDIDFFEVVGTGLSTSDEATAKMHAKESGYKVKKRKVPVISLTAICKQYADSDIHFLKIDAEGAELAILKGLNLGKVRPWIILIESTIPNSTIETYKEWEYSLTERGYHHIYFDGISRYYVADEHAELDLAFKTPPIHCVDYRRREEVFLERNARQVKVERDSAKDHVKKLKVQLNGKSEMLEETQEALEGAQEACAKEHEHNEQLQTEWDSAKDHVKKLKVQIGEQGDTLKETHEALEVVQEARLKEKEHVEKLKVRLDEQSETIEETHEVLEGTQDALVASQKTCAQEQAHSRQKQNEFIAVEAHRAQEMQNVLNSISWRITRPIRISAELFVRVRPYPGWLVVSVLRFPMRTARWFLSKILAFVISRSGLDFLPVAWVRKYPRLYTMLRRSAQGDGLPVTPLNRASIASHPVSSVQQQAVDISFVLPLPSGERKIYIYVDHTITNPTSTGVQRVTRAIASSLNSLGENLCFVKWDDESSQCVLINIEERRYLAKWNGPPVSDAELKIYPSEDDALIAASKHRLGENNWLIVPEVTHITPQDHPVTLDVLQWSRRAGLKTGFVFYDALPLRREEFKDMAPIHAEYMQQLLLADVIWPISQWSADDLIAFWVENECADNKSMPEVKAVHLSGESQFCPRVLEPEEGEKLILTVGTVEPRKYQVQLIRAFQAYRKVHPDCEWRLILVGNLHPLVAEEVVNAQKADKAISHVGHVTDKELDSLYRSSAFTVFPSVDEGFGLPILESLWYAKPCICANFGSMSEVAEGGGCYAIDTRDQAKLDEALARLIDDEAFRRELAKEATTHPIRSWDDYGAIIQERVEKEGHLETGIGRIYYSIDATIQFAANTGIQRVARQLACGLLDIGVSLIPVKWDKVLRRFATVTRDDRVFFARYSGPDADLWDDWVEPDINRKNDWFFMPDLPLNLSNLERVQMLELVTKLGLHTAAVFFDAIPWKMREIYPPHFVQAHHDYMMSLSEYDYVFPISVYTQDDLIDFLGVTLERPQGLDSRIKAVVLPGEFPKNPRVTTVSSRSDGPINILSVGTVEPRKNHETLFQAFELAKRNSDLPLRLVIAGSSQSIEPELGERVRAYVDANPDVTWEEGVDDSRLRELHLACDFTVYPSIEEGFGLPILESLWYAKPCVCADFGSMQEAAEGGGCLMIDTRSIETMAKAIVDMAEDTALREGLALEAVERTFKTWRDYAMEVAARLSQAFPARSLELPLTREEIDSRLKVLNLVPRPRLSVCISTYNRAEWLATSLKNWTRLYPEPLLDVELLVCDNASTDHTPEVVKPYMERKDFSYHRNLHNVGMLGNLRETAHHAHGEYIWILGDDDLMIPGCIERVMDTLKSHPDVALVYLNYAFTLIEDARTITDFDKFFAEATPIVPPEEDLEGPIKTICARNENFFTAIYTIVFRRDHAIKAYSQDTSGRPFSTMLTCIPTTYYVLNYLMDEPGVWIGEPQVVSNMNVSWLKYATLWILERIPEVYDLAEAHGVPAQVMDKWRSHTFPGLVQYFKMIFDDDPLNNAAYFRPDRVLRRFKHIPEFALASVELRDVYTRAHENGHPAATKPVSVVFLDKYDN